MTSDSTPKGLQYWTDRLQQEPLPILGQSGRQLVNKLLSPSISLNQMHALLERDPVLSLHTLLAANRLNRNKDTDIKNLRHAISLIGLGRLQEIISQVPVLKTDLDNPHHLQYLRALSDSLHAAEQAFEWIAQRQPARAEDAYWNTLIFNAPSWYLARSAPVELQRIDQLRQAGTSLLAADRAVLGCTRLEIAREMAAFWQLSEYETDQMKALYTPPWRQLLRLAHLAGMQETVQPDRQQEARLLHHPYFAPLVASWLAVTVNDSWYSRQSLRIHRIAAVLLGMPLSRSVTRIHHIAVQAAHRHPLPGVMLPAAQLLLPVPTRRRRRPVAKPQAQKQSKPAKPVASRPASVNPAVLKAFIQQAEQRPDSFADLGALMQAAAHAVRAGLGAERCMLLLKSGQSKQLRSFFAVGYKKAPALARLSLPLDPSHLFGRMLSKPSSLHVNETNYSRFAALLPVQFSKVSDVRDFMLMSVTTGKTPVGILLVSRLPGEKPLTTQQYGGFKRLCQSISVAMQNIAQRRRQRANTAGQ